MRPLVGLPQAEGHGGRTGIAIAIDVDEHLFFSNAELVSNRVDDPLVGLMGDKERHLGERPIDPLQQLESDAAHAVPPRGKTSLPFIETLMIAAAAIDGEGMASTGLKRQDVGLASVGAGDDVNQGCFALPRPHHDPLPLRPRQVARSSHEISREMSSTPTTRMFFGSKAMRALGRHRSPDLIGTPAPAQVIGGNVATAEAILQEGRGIGCIDLGVSVASTISSMSSAVSPASVIARSAACSARSRVDWSSAANGAL